MMKARESQYFDKENQSIESVGADALIGPGMKSTNG